jgi:cysteine protease ATG4
MKLKQFRGVIGGKPKKALYFLGRHNNDFIYLDPHYVHSANKKME